MTKLGKCPQARTGRSGACRAAGCNHYSGAERNICTCCVHRVPKPPGLDQNMIDKYGLVVRFGTMEARQALEAELLAWLEAHPRSEDKKRPPSWAFRPLMSK